MASQMSPGRTLSFPISTMGSWTPRPQYPCPGSTSDNLTSRHSQGTPDHRDRDGNCQQLRVGGRAAGLRPKRWWRLGLAGGRGPQGAGATRAPAAKSLVPPRPGGPREGTPHALPCAGPRAAPCQVRPRSGTLTLQGPGGAAPARRDGGRQQQRQQQQQRPGRPGTDAARDPHGRRGGCGQRRRSAGC
jgi:hypothetical protein